jgi:hypothetical protein
MARDHGIDDSPIAAIVNRDQRFSDEVVVE